MEDTHIFKPETSLDKDGYQKGKREGGDNFKEKKLGKKKKRKEVRRQRRNNDHRLKGKGFTVRELFGEKSSNNRTEYIIILLLTYSYIKHLHNSSSIFKTPEQGKELY